MESYTVGPLTFQQWIQRLIDERFRTSTALAEAMGLQLTPFTRGVAAGTFNVVNLLKLAKVADERPSTVLRMAGKGDVAELIESLYGKPSPMTQHQREVSDLVGTLDVRDRAMAVEMMRTIVAGAIQLRHAGSQTASPAHGRDETATGSHATAASRRR